MPVLPTSLKRRLVPLWNGGHRFAWQVRELAGAVGARRFERCAVCGRFGPMLYRRRVIPPRLVGLWGLSPAVAEALARKESTNCAWCGAKLRARRMAEVLLGLYPVGSPVAPAASLAEWVWRPEARALRVAEINLVEGVHEQVSTLPRFWYSEFLPGVAPGSVSEGVRCEDLTRLSYEDESFDLVLTSETLEHVPDLGRALSEVRRVLVPGGRHVFTVPILPGVPRTYARARLRGDGTVERLAPPVCHPGGDVGYPVFTEIGLDFPQILRGAGFEVHVMFGPTTERDLGQVFVCRKPGGAVEPNS